MQTVMQIEKALKTVMQTEKALKSDLLHVTKVSWKIRIPIMYNFAVVYSWNFIFS